MIVAAMKTSLNIADDAAGNANFRSAFNMLMNAAATAINIRNGMLMRASWIVSSSLPAVSW